MHGTKKALEDSPLMEGWGPTCPQGHLGVLNSRDASENFRSLSDPFLHT